MKIPRLKKSRKFLMLVTCGVTFSFGLRAEAPETTASGILLPAGWHLKRADRFGTGAARNIRSIEDLRGLYCEGQYYNRTACESVAVPNFVINGQEGLYGHFEEVIEFATDHITIRGRGQPDGHITTGELVSHPMTRSFCVEARYTVPNTPKSWPAFWVFGDRADHDNSELDIEQPITPDQGIHQITLFNHPTKGTVEIKDPHFTEKEMTYDNDAFDGSTYPHTYAICYDDKAATTSRYLDGKELYIVRNWKWNASLGGTGHGPDPSLIINLAVGGLWPGSVKDPASYRADLDLYTIDYYGP